MPREPLAKRTLPFSSLGSGALFSAAVDRLVEKSSAVLVDRLVGQLRSISPLALVDCLVMIVVLSFLALSSSAQVTRQRSHHPSDGWMESVGAVNDSSPCSLR